MMRTPVPFRVVLGILCCQVLMTATSHAAPMLIVDPEAVSLGTIPRGSVVGSKVTVYNAGDEALEIRGLSVSCPCLSFQPLPEGGVSIPPAGEYVVPLEYDTETRLGEFKAGLVIVSNDPENTVVSVWVHGFIDVPVRVEPATGIHWTSVRGVTLEETLRLWPAGPSQALEFVGAQVAGTEVRVESSSVEENGARGIELQFTLPDAPEPIEYNTTVDMLFTVNGVDQVLQVPFTGTVLTELDVRFNARNRNHKSGDFVGQIVVRPNGSEGSAAVLTLQTSGPFRAELDPDELARERRINVYAMHTEPGPKQEGAVMLTTTSKEQPYLTVPVSLTPAPAIMADTRGFEVIMRAGSTATREISFINVYHQAAQITEARVEVVPPVVAEVVETPVTGGPVAAEVKAGTKADDTVDPVAGEVPAEAPVDDTPVDLPDALVAVARVDQEVLSTTPETVADQPAKVSLTLTGAAEAKEQRERVIVTTNIVGFEAIEIPITIKTVLPDNIPLDPPSSSAKASEDRSEGGIFVPAPGAAEPETPAAGE